MNRQFTAFMFLGSLFLALGFVFLPLGIMLGIKADPLFLLCFGLIGLVFIVVGFIFISMELKKRRQKEDLLSRGYHVTAKILQIEQNTMLQINGSHPYVIQCGYEDPYTNTVHLFKSEDIPYDPSSMLTGEEVQVYVDPDNFDRYYVDLDSVMLPVADHRGLL